MHCQGMEETASLPFVKDDNTDRLITELSISVGVTITIKSIKTAASDSTVF